MPSSPLGGLGINEILSPIDGANSTRSDSPERNKRYSQNDEDVSSKYATITTVTIHEGKEIRDISLIKSPNHQDSESDSEKVNISQKPSSRSRGKKIANAHDDVQTSKRNVVRPKVTATRPIPRAPQKGPKNVVIDPVLSSSDDERDHKSHLSESSNSDDPDSTPSRSNFSSRNGKIHDYNKPRGKLDPNSDRTTDNKAKKRMLSQEDSDRDSNPKQAKTSVFSHPKTKNEPNTGKHKAFKEQAQRRREKVEQSRSPSISRGRKPDGRKSNYRSKGEEKQEYKSTEFLSTDSSDSDDDMEHIIKNKKHHPGPKLKATPPTTTPTPPTTPRKMNTPSPRKSQRIMPPRGKGIANKTLGSSSEDSASDTDGDSDSKLSHSKSSNDSSPPKIKSDQDKIKNKVILNMFRPRKSQSKEKHDKSPDRSQTPDSDKRHLPMEIDEMEAENTIDSYKDNGKSQFKKEESVVKSETKHEVVDERSHPTRISNNGKRAKRWPKTDDRPASYIKYIHKNVIVGDSLNMEN